MCMMEPSYPMEMLVWMAGQHQFVTDVTDGSIVGFKYFAFIGNGKLNFTEFDFV